MIQPLIQTHFLFRIHFCFLCHVIDKFVKRAFLQEKATVHANKLVATIASKHDFPLTFTKRAGVGRFFFLSICHVDGHDSSSFQCALNGFLTMVILSFENTEENGILKEETLFIHANLHAWQKFISRNSPNGTLIL